MNILKNHVNKTISLTNEEFSVVESFFTEQYFKKREMIIKENDPVDHVYFIVSGLVKLLHIDSEGKEHIISFAMEDWWESDYMAFYTRTKATQYLQCLEHTTVLKLSFDGYQKLLNEVPKMTDFFLKKHLEAYFNNKIKTYFTCG